MADMTAKEIMIKCCEMKFYDIRKRSEIDLWTENDRNDLQSWPPDLIHNILIKMAPTNCPWCMRFKGDCESCSYGKRHGICKNIHSDYRNVEIERKQNNLPYLSQNALSAIRTLLKEYKQCQLQS